MSDTVLRVGECAALDVAARAVEPDGSGGVTGRRRPKTDQDGEARRDVPGGQREPGHRRTVVATVLALLALLCAGCSVTEEQPQRRVSGQMSQAELRAQREAAQDELLAFADCLENSDYRVQPANYPDCLSHNLTGWRMRQSGYQSTLLEIANKVRAPDAGGRGCGVRRNGRTASSSVRSVAASVRWMRCSFNTRVSVTSRTRWPPRGVGSLRHSSSALRIDSRSGRHRSWATLNAPMTPYEFIDKWRASTLTERSASHQHFLDLCELLDEPKPAEADPTGETYCFERGARKDTGGDGWADVWKRHHFAWEYKGHRADLDAAFGQLRQYALALENPPLLIVSDMRRFRIRTNWTNSVSRSYEFGLDDLADAATRDRLKWAFSDPERLRPGETRQSLTEKAAQSFATLAQSLRERGHDPQAVAHFVNRLVFCMFADDVGLLPDHMFTRMLEQARRTPAHFADLAGDLFRVMASGRRVGFETVDWFNGGLFDDDTVLPLEKFDIDTVLAASKLDWSEIDPSILGTLFERGLDPGKRAQLGAHYTDRDKIMLLVEPVVIRPWLAEWTAEKEEIAAELERARAAKSPATRTKLRNEAERRYRRFLNRLRAFTVLDPACGSGNFLYLALQALKDLEHRVQFEAESLGFQRAFPEIGPANVKGIEINPYAAELARVSVWIGEIQWMRRNGFSEARDPILKALDTIECRDAILSPDGAEPEWPTADVVIGNPPFLGAGLQIGKLGGDYVSRLRRTYSGRVPGGADLVCYWFAKAGTQMEAGAATRAGLVATNSIRGGASRRALQTATETRPLFEAWSDEPWVNEGAAVRVSLICFSRTDDQVRVRARLDGQHVDEIYADLTARRESGGIDLTRLQTLPANSGIAFKGDTKGGPFDVPGDQAREWLRLPANPHGRTNADV